MWCVLLLFFILRCVYGCLGPDDLFVLQSMYMLLSLLHGVSPDHPTLVHHGHINLGFGMVRELLRKVCLLGRTSFEEVFKTNVFGKH